MIPGGGVCFPCQLTDAWQRGFPSIRSELARLKFQPLYVGARYWPEPAFNTGLNKVMACLHSQVFLLENGRDVTR